MRKNLVFLLLACVSSFLILCVEFASPSFVHNIDLKLKDLRLMLRGPIKPPSSVAIVAIDNKSVKEIGRWPWSREKVGALIEGMADYGAKITVLDVVFSETQDPVSDAALAESIALSGNVIAGHFFRNEIHPIDPEVLAQVQSSKIQQLHIDAGVATVPLIEYENMDANIAMTRSGCWQWQYGGRSARDNGVLSLSWSAVVCSTPPTPFSRPLAESSPLAVLFASFMNRARNSLDRAFTGTSHFFLVVRQLPCLSKPPAGTNMCT